MKWNAKLTLVGVLLAVTGTALATDNPGSGEPIEYDGTLNSGSTVSGSIGFSDPNDGYDWYCFEVSSGREVEITLTRTSGDLLLNLGLLEGVVDSGGQRGDLSNVWGDSVNTSNPDVQLAATPGFSGPATLWVSTWTGQNGGDYDLTMTGGSALTSDCKEPPQSVPSSSTWSLVVMLLLFGLVSFAWFARQQNR